MGRCLGSARMALFIFTSYLSRKDCGTSAVMSNSGLPIPKMMPFRDEDDMAERK